MFPSFGWNKKKSCLNLAKCPNNQGKELENNSANWNCRSFVGQRSFNTVSLWPTKWLLEQQKITESCQKCPLIDRARISKSRNPFQSDKTICMSYTPAFAKMSHASVWGQVDGKRNKKQTSGKCPDPIFFIDESTKGILYSPAFWWPKLPSIQEVKFNAKVIHYMNAQLASALTICT